MATAIDLSDDDLGEIFALFTSSTEEEINQIYSESNGLFFRRENLDEEYSLVQEKREFACDAWRAVTLFLERHGYTIGMPPSN